MLENILVGIIVVVVFVAAVVVWELENGHHGKIEEEETEKPDSKEEN